MERRKFVIGAGALATGSAAAVGSGAFTSVQADRDITVDVADDDEAFLRLSEHPSNPNAAYADVDEGTLAVDISTDNPDQGDEYGDEFQGEGVNKEASTNILEIAVAKNQGTQNATVYVDPEFRTSQDDGLVDFVATDLPGGGSASLTGAGENDDPEEWDGKRVLAPGESFDIGLFILEDGNGLDVPETATIIADADLA